MFFCVFAMGWSFCKDGVISFHQELDLELGYMMLGDVAPQGKSIRPGRFAFTLLLTPSRVLQKSRIINSKVFL